MVTGVVDGRTYAFIALERIGGVMVYDVTDPAQALCFVPAAQRADGKALLLAACEVFSTLAVYACTGTEPTEQLEQPVFMPDEDAISPKTGDDGETQLWLVCALVLSASFVIDGALKMLAKR